MSKILVVDDEKKIRETISDYLTCDKFIPMMEDIGCSVSRNITSDISIKCNKELLSLAVNNLMSNAIKYAKRSDDKLPNISISLEKRKSKGFEFKVYNDCDPESITDGKAIWDVLSRADSSRERREDSTGMGLPVTAEILRLHGFKYGCRKREEGVEFYIFSNK